MLDLVFSAEGGSASGGKNYNSRKSPNEKFFREILDTAIKEVKINPVRSRGALRALAASNGIKNKKVEVSLNLVGKAKIKELNKKYRNTNEVTDVLSFPLEESRFKKHAILPLGDIFICLPFAVQESKRQNISLEKELAWLTIHGFLHLLGYDHEKSATGKKKMFSLENKILKELKY